MIPRYCIAASALLISFAPAHACRAPKNPHEAHLDRLRMHKESAKRADVIVRGRLFEEAAKCDTTRHCGEWIQTIEVRKGTAAPYYLMDPDEMLLTCSREYVKPGKVGTFHLQARGDGTYFIIDDIR
jgi:hypothetical protein